MTAETSGDRATCVAAWVVVAAWQLEGPNESGGAVGEIAGIRYGRARPCRAFNGWRGRGGFVLQRSCARTGRDLEWPER